MRIGLIGCGLIGAKRAAAARGHDIVALADLQPERAEALSRKHGGTVCRHWQDVVAADVDAILVATYHDTLAPISLAAVEAGRHVLVEKPAGRTASEIQPIVEAARRTGRVVKAGFNHRFHPALQKAKALAESGELGPLMYIRARYGHGGRPGMEKEWRCQPEISGGGESIDQAPHLIDLARWFFGNDIRFEYGYAPTLYWNTPVDDNCFIALRTPRNQLAWLHATWTEWKNMFSFEIIGRDAKLVVDGLGGSYGVERLTFYKMLPQMGPPETTSWEYPFADDSWSLEIADFSAAIAERRPACGDIEDALAVMKIVDQLHHESSK